MQHVKNDLKTDQTLFFFLKDECVYFLWGESRPLSSHYVWWRTEVPGTARERLIIFVMWGYLHSLCFHHTLPYCLLPCTTPPPLWCGWESLVCVWLLHKGIPKKTSLVQEMSLALCLLQWELFNYIYCHIFHRQSITYANIIQNKDQLFT